MYCSFLFPGGIDEGVRQAEGESCELRYALGDKHEQCEVKKRTYRQGGDEVFLQRIRDGTLRVDVVTDVVETQQHRHHYGKWHKMKLEKDDDGYLLVRCYVKGARKQTRLHRLVWMMMTGEPIPEGFDVHHFDGDKLNNHPDNLELVDSYEHRCSHLPQNKWKPIELSDEEAIVDDLDERTAFV